MKKWDKEFEDKLFLNQDSYYTFENCYMGELLNKISLGKEITKVKISCKKGVIKIERIK